MRVLIYNKLLSGESRVGKYTGEMVQWLKKGYSMYCCLSQPYFPLWKASSQIFLARGNKMSIWVPRKPNGVKRIIHLLSFSLAPLVLYLAKKNYDLIFTVVPTIFCIPSALFFSKIFNKNQVLGYTPRS